MSSKMRRPWTLDEIESLRDMLERGVPMHRISEKLQRSYLSIEGVALRRGIDLPRPEKADG